MPLIDGKSLAKRLLAELKQRLEQAQVTPHLAVLLVGDDPASHLYVKLKRKAAEEVGVQTTLQQVSAEVSDAELIKQITAWNQDPNIHAILVQLPLPPGHNQDEVMQSLSPAKDVDGFHPDNTARLFAGEPTIVPPVHEAILRLTNETPLHLPGTTAVILANSIIFAEPLKRLLTTAGMFVHVLSPDALEAETLARADVIVTALGKPHFLQPSQTKSGAVIIDVGTHKTPEGKVCGDADTSAYQIQQPETWITPVPGGVGPMTIAMLMKNTFELTQQTTSR